MNYFGIYPIATISNKKLLARIQRSFQFTEHSRRADYGSSRVHCCDPLDLGGLRIAGHALWFAFVLGPATAATTLVSR